MGKWAAMALVGEWHGEELGMAAAGAEQKLGHQKVSSHTRSIIGRNFFARRSRPSRRGVVKRNRGIRWIRRSAESLFAKMPDFNEAEAAKTLGTTPLELERKWQLWMYAYLAGMPPDPHSMPMNMRVVGQFPTERTSWDLSVACLRKQDAPEISPVLTPISQQRM